MPVLIPIALFGWIPLVLLMFSILPARRAAILVFMLAWMFLPVSGYKVEGLPPFHKMNATTLAVLLATAIFQTDRFWLFRPSLFDLPMLGFCLAPFISLQAVGASFASSAYWSLEHFLEWGLPYFLGRLYIRDLNDLSELVRLLVICGLIYVPFCLYEIKMSPQLNRLVYGFFQESWHTTKRGWGWRPLVFMQTGLMVATWMTSAAVLAYWGWRRRALRPIWHMPLAMVTVVLLVTALLCMSTGASILMAMMLAVLQLAHLTKRSWIMAALILGPLLYISSRVTGIWDGNWMISAAAMVSQERSDSMATRVGSEDNFIRHALKRPLLGWGPGPQAMPPVEERVASKAIWDALWIINFTKFGALGLAAWILVGALPGLLFLRRYGPATWGHPGVAAGLALLAVLASYQVDCLFNSMIQPIFTFAFGGITSVALARRKVLSTRYADDVNAANRHYLNDARFVRSQAKPSKSASI